LDDTFEAVDLAAPPLFHRTWIEPSDADEDVNRTHVILGAECRLRGSGYAFDKGGSVLTTHRCIIGVPRLLAQASCFPAHRRPH
jgi:hypothetical protein